MSRNYKFHSPEGLYFIRFATVYRIDVFIRNVYADCMVKNLNHCIDKNCNDMYVSFKIFIYHKRDACGSGVFNIFFAFFATLRDNSYTE
jgi:hypothetical protein